MPPQGFRIQLSNKYTNLDPNDPNNKMLKEKCEKISKIISKRVYIDMKHIDLVALLGV